MNKFKFLLVVGVVLGLTLMVTGGFSQEKKPESRFSNTGLKASIGTISSEMIGERQMQEGEGGFLSLGYGFTDRFSLWLTLFGSQHARVNSDAKTDEFGGLELNLEHKFKSNSCFQPYGKVGVGFYRLGKIDSESGLLGAGINLGLGVDFFFARHFGIGAELAYKKLDYVERKEEREEGDYITKISPHLNGDTVAFMLRFTVQ